MEDPFIDQGNHLVDIDKSKEVYRKLSKQLSRDDNQDIANTAEESSETTLKEHPSEGRFDLHGFLSNDKKNSSKKQVKQVINIWDWHGRIYV